MKILYVVNARIPTPRAYGIQIMKTCEALWRAGVDIELIVPNRRVKMPEDPFEYYGIEKNFRLSLIRVPDLLAYGRLGFLLSTLWFSEKVRWLTAFSRADIIYSRDALLLMQYVLLGRTLVYEAHVPPSRISLFVARHAYRLIVISHGLREVYETAGIPRAKITVVPDATDADIFTGVPDRAQARDALGVPQDISVITYTGHLYPRKGVGIVASAAVQLPEVMFFFVGGTTTDVAEFREKWSMLTNVRIIGHVPHAAVPLYLRASTILVLPNSGLDEDSARFTSPMKLFEYMASGTPIVASDVPAVREVLDESSAFLVAPDSPEELVQGLKRALSDPGRALEKARTALCLVREYTWEKRARAIYGALRPSNV